MDFSQDDLFEAIDREVRTVLDRAGVEGPPVDALVLAQTTFNLRVEFADEEDDGPPGRFGPRPRRRPPPDTLVLRSDQSDEGQQAVAARAIARRLAPAVLQRLGIAPGTEQKGAQTQLVGLIAARLLLPTRWFAADARRAGLDLAELKAVYPSAGCETLAWRLLEVTEEPCVVTIVDDGTVAGRRSNRFPAGRTLTEAERLCHEKVAATDKPARVRADGWTAWGWPARGIPYRRIILRAVPDDV